MLARPSLLALATCVAALALPGTLRAAPPPAAQPILDQGEASWYGPRHAGHLTTSGERFDPSKMTAAHASLPLGTVVRVTDIRTGRSVVVRVNDREPPHGVRCIDLSEGAALALGIHSQGIADVTLSAVAPRDAAVEVAEAPDAALSAPHDRRHRRHAAR